MYWEKMFNMCFPFQVNLDHETREATRRNLTIITFACFEEAQTKTYTLMKKDSYPRFLKSTYYRDLIEQAPSHRTGKHTWTSLLPPSGTVLGEQRHRVKQERLGPESGCVVQFGLEFVFTRVSGTSNTSIYPEAHGEKPIADPWRDYNGRKHQFL